MRLIILGAGGYGRTVYDLAEQSGKYAEIFFLDDNFDIGKCKDYHNYITQYTEFYPAFGNNEDRLSFLNELEAEGANIATIIHESAYVSPKATIGKGTVILPKSIVNTGTEIKRGCIINCGAIVDHDCIVNEGVHVCLGAIVKAENNIPKCLKIAAGETVENRKHPLNGDK